MPDKPDLSSLHAGYSGCAIRGIFGFYRSRTTDPAQPLRAGTGPVTETLRRGDDPFSLPPPLAGGGLQLCPLPPPFERQRVSAGQAACVQWSCPGAPPRAKAGACHDIQRGVPIFCHAFPPRAGERGRAALSPMRRRAGACNFARPAPYSRSCVDVALPSEGPILPLPEYRILLNYRLKP